MAETIQDRIDGMNIMKERENLESTRNSEMSGTACEGRSCQGRQEKGGLRQQGKCGEQIVTDAQGGRFRVTEDGHEGQMYEKIN